MHTSRIIVMTLVALAAAGPVAAQRAHIGAHGGYDFDRDAALIGGQLSLPVGGALELYPSVDAYFVNGGSLVGFSGDLKYRLNPGALTQWYLGGGVNVLRASAGGAASSDVGWDFLFGVETRTGYTHPYVEGRFLEHGGSTFQVAAGLNITLF